jgi:serine/threonine protein kinase
MVDLHPNLITYYDKHEDRDFIYLAIEKCDGNLENLIELMKAAKLAKDRGSTDWHSMALG